MAESLYSKYRTTESKMAKVAKVETNKDLLIS